MNEKVSLTKHTKFSGCGAKLGPGVLEKALCGLAQPQYPDLVADFSGCEDSGLYRIAPNKLLVQTVDFFPPIVDDPYLFGRIAAANALSDIYAMGGKPLTALALVCFPVKNLGMENLRAMMDGGLSALVEAGCALLGGHSIEDPEPKLGYAITGEVIEGKEWRNNRVEEGCAFILTKPLGTGLINMAFRGECVADEALTAAQNSMGTLNRKAAEILQKYSVKACTDVTGFGLLGHLAEMVVEAKAGAKIVAKDVPQLPEAYEYASMGLVPEGAYRNKQGRGNVVKNFNDIDPIMLDVLFDPQTSGGLLAAVKEEEANSALNELKQAGLNAAIIGNTTNSAGVIEVV